MLCLKIDNKGRWQLLYYNNSRRTGESVLSNEPVQWNQRTHIAGVYDNGRLNLFVNGVKQRQAITVKDIKPKGRQLRIGSNLWLGDRNHFFKGSIDQVRISKVRMYKTSFTPADKLSADENSMAMSDLNEKAGRLILDQAGNEFARLRVDMEIVRGSEELENDEFTSDKPSALKPTE